MLIEPYRTQRMLLRNLTAEDCGDLYVGWLNDPAVTRLTEARHQIHTTQSTVDFVLASNDNPEVLLLGLFADGTGHIGNIKLGPIRRPYPVAEIGILVGRRDGQAQGYGREAIAALSAIGFGQLDLRKLEASVYASNAASERAFLACGFQREGVRRAAVMRDGRPEDLILFGLLREDPRPAPRHAGSP